MSKIDTIITTVLTLKDTGGGAAFSTGVDNKKVEEDNEKALELDNRFFFHISA